MTINAVDWEEMEDILLVVENFREFILNKIEL